MGVTRMPHIYDESTRNTSTSLLTVHGDPASRYCSRSRQAPSGQAAHLAACPLYLITTYSLDSQVETLAFFAFTVYIVQLSFQTISIFLTSTTQHQTDTAPHTCQYIPNGFPQSQSHPHRLIFRALTLYSFSSHGTRRHLPSP